MKEKKNKGMKMGLEEIKKMNADELSQFCKDQVVDSKQGLSVSEAETRLQKYGLNALEDKRKSKWAMFFGFFWGPIPWMIEIAAILSAYLQRWPDFIMISALLLINAALGFFQEFKADNAIEALKQTLALKARVLREGKWQEIEASKLVPGDVISVKLGNIIPADIRLIEGEYLSVDQSALTGESLPVEKAVGDSAFSGTIAKVGEMVGVVTATGMQTYFGKTAKLVQSAKTISHFQRAVMHIGQFLIYTTLSICAIIFAISIYRIDVTHSLTASFGEITIFILVLVVAGIPVALPAVLSVTMAIGANRMAKMKAIVSKLIAIEELAGIDILCSDKTGTLTKNELSVENIAPFNETNEDEVLLIACLASNQKDRDAIDGAIFSKLGDEAKLGEYQVEKFIPFDPVNKRTEAIIKDKGQEFRVCKGAPQVVLSLTNPDEKMQQAIETKVNEQAQRGFRTLGVAKADSEGKSWQFLGLISLFDPPREDTKDTIAREREQGVQVKMVTGDHVAIAKEVASALDLGTNILPVSDIFDEKVLPAKRNELLESADGFAQVFPEHKFEIVKSLQNNKHIIGMTGDGVNDAPALKQADVGIAVSNATDAARSAADLVLTEPGLMVITKAIEEARRIFGRMKSYAMYRISETCRLLFFLLLAMLVFNTHPLTAIMIIMIALLNDIPIMMIAYDHMAVAPKPVEWDMKEVMSIAIGLAIVGVVSTFGLFWIGDRLWAMDFASKRTLAFMAILCGGNLTIYLTRNRGMFWDKPHPEKKFFLATLFSQVAGTLASVYGLGTSDFVGIGWKYAGLSWIYILIWFVICAITKYGIYGLLDLARQHKKSFHAQTSKGYHSHAN